MVRVWYYTRWQIITYLRVIDEDWVEEVDDEVIDEDWVEEVDDEVIAEDWVEEVDDEVIDEHWVEEVDDEVGGGDGYVVTVEDGK